MEITCHGSYCFITAKLIHTLPNTTADFSPKISSTQNFTTRPGFDEETESQDDLAEAEAGDDMHVDNDMERVDDRVDEVSKRQDHKKEFFQCCLKIESDVMA